MHILRLRNEDPLRHVKHYLSIVDNIQADGAQGIHLGYASSISPSKEKWQNGLTKYLPLKSRHGISSYHDSLTNSFRKLDQFAQFRFNSLTEEEGWNRIEEYVQYQDDLWDDLSPPINVSSISEAMQPTFRRRLKRACNQISYLETPARKVGLKTPYLIYDYCGGSHEADECKQNDPAEQACLSGGDIYDDPSLMRKSETSEPEAPTFAITTRSGVSTQDPPFSAPSQSTSANHIEGATEKEGPEDAEPSIIQEPAPRPSIFYQPSKSSNLPFPSRLTKQKKDDEDERLLSIFKQIHINLPFLEAMIHTPKGAKVLKESAPKRRGPRELQAAMSYWTPGSQERLS
ncbi:hypothetical protein Tco_0375395 [Tanacetum coccineum]